MEKKAEKNGGRRSFIEVLEETERFVSWCKNQAVQMEASELLQEAKEAFVSFGGSDNRAWKPMNDARQMTNEVRVKDFKSVAETAIATAEKTLASAKVSENGFYTKAVSSLTEAKALITESEKDRRTQIQSLKDAEAKAQSASRALELLQAEQERAERRNGNGRSEGSARALEDQGRSLRKQGYDRGAKEADKRGSRRYQRDGEER